MIAHRSVLAFTIGCIVIAGTAAAQPQPSAEQQMQALGPENSAMQRQVGIWDVVETAWDAPGAKPTITQGLVADRRMVGSILEETLHTASGSAGDALRIDYLSFDRVEGRWKYVSMDTRSPVGLMPAASVGRGTSDTIVLAFEPFAIAGAGTKITGQMLRMDEVITWQGPNRDFKQQYFIMADGVGTLWLAHQYSYSRRL